MLECQCQNVINYLDELSEAMEAVGGYIVLKPLDGNHEGHHH